MTPLPTVREPAPFRRAVIRRPGPLALLGGALVAAVAAVVAGIVALVLAAAVAFAALLALVVGGLAFLAWRMRGGRRSSGWREARVGDAWVGYRWDATGPERG